MNAAILWARCDRTDLDVTAMGTLEGWGVRAEIHACRACVFHLDQLLWQMVMRGNGAIRT
ncbi:hypothetical protein ABZS86_00015 [Streptomyces sp. NPDC005355]|uniref:hypothetical protein n=1 Tax=Streptomyces sp. NPDC005355 TaxID=3157038 RepID=UPI0033BCFEF4